MGDPVVRYENNAGPATITTPKGTAHGWACLTCNRVFAAGDPSENERLARSCCATDLPCETAGCQGRHEKGWVYCPACAAKRIAADYLAMPEVAWDGTTPLVLFRGDHYFYDEDELLDYCDDENVKPSDLNLVICEEAGTPLFDVLDFLHDSLFEDAGAGDFDAPPEEIEKIVDDWIQKNAPKSWVEGKTRPTLGSLPKEELSE